VTANLLVRREAWASVGGFLEGVRSGGDNEFSWRLQDAGWTLAYRPAAIVEHHHRDSVRKLARQAARYGAGRAWLRRRYPTAPRDPGILRETVRSAAGALVWTLTGRFERAAFKVLDAVYVVSNRSANLLSNTPPGRRPRRDGAPVAAIASDFPALDSPEPVSRLRAMGASVPVEARSRPVRVDREAARSLPIAWAEDDGALRRAAATLWLVARRPLRVARYALRPARDTTPQLREIAPRARRLAELHVQEVQALDPASEADAEALARVLGLVTR
jgi:hypothetical protein